MKRIHILLALSLALAVSCSKELDTAGGKITKVDCSATCSPSNQILKVEASGEWTLSLTFSDQTEYDFTPWAYFGKYTDVDSISMSGNGDASFIQFNWSGNKSPLSRSATITLTCGTASQSVTFTQLGTSKSADIATDLESDILGYWMELPETDTKGLYYITHPMTIAGKETRNYSFGWDPENLVALWVAYPLNAFTIGSGARTNEWGMDPKIPRKYQPVLYSPYRGYYDRGHQCPSADRLNYTANVETFYGTNMTPQKNTLNAAAWGVLEGMVRKWARQYDTLYVVTGCVVTGSTDKAYDNDGKAITVPTGYYKALLGYKQTGTVADTGSKGGYTAIAFWFDHKAYDDNQNAVLQQIVTIDELEEKTGLNFFVKLERQSTTISEKVESTVSDWWKKNC